MYCNKVAVLFVVTVNAVVVLSCPNKCTCNTIMRGVILNCTNQLLTVIPNIPSDSYEIDLTRNQFTNIRRFTFYNIPELNFLYLNGNELQNIEEYSFVLLDRLRHLYLHDNSLTTITKGLFRDLPDLYILRLQNNKISVIESFAFTNLPDLGRVFLEYNSISVISEYSFVNVSSLYILNLELVCNCQNFPFLTWVKQVSRYDVTCSDRNHVELSSLHMCHFKDCDNSPCPSDYCANGGSISIDGNGDIVCFCVPEWTGTRCTDESCSVKYGCQNGADCDNIGTCICKDGFAGILCATHPTTQLNDIQKESTASEVTSETTTYAVILGPVFGIVGLSVIVVAAILFMKRTEVLKKFKDIRKQNDSALYENEIRLDNRVYHDLTLARGDNDSPYDAIYLIPKIG